MEEPVFIPLSKELEEGVVEDKIWTVVDRLYSRALKEFPQIVKRVSKIHAFIYPLVWSDDLEAVPDPRISFRYEEYIIPVEKEVWLKRMNVPVIPITLEIEFFLIRHNEAWLSIYLDANRERPEFTFTLLDQDDYAHIEDYASVNLLTWTLSERIKSSFERAVEVLEPKIKERLEEVKDILKRLVR
jgi:hypothetical protein